MKITILENSKIKYNEFYLIPFQTYHDIDDKTAQDLIAAKEAKLSDDSIEGVSFTSAPQAPHTEKFDVNKNGGYVAEAALTAEQKKALEEKGEAVNDKGEKVAKDNTPVTGKDVTLPKDTTPEPTTRAKVYDEFGKELTEEEIKAKEAAATAATANKEALPSAQDANRAPEV